MPKLNVEINGKAMRVEQGTSIAAALLLSGDPCRLSVTGQPRSAVCGMGICYECRAVVNGRAHQKTCQLACQEGMVVTTQC